MQLKIMVLFEWNQALIHSYKITFQNDSDNVYLHLFHRIKKCWMAWAQNQTFCIQVWNQHFRINL